MVFVGQPWPTSTNPYASAGKKGFTRWQTSEVMKTSEVVEIRIVKTGRSMSI